MKKEERQKLESLVRQSEQCFAPRFQTLALLHISKYMWLMPFNMTVYEAKYRLVPITIIFTYRLTVTEVYVNLKTMYVLQYSRM
jgi:hypothetical protein